MYCRIEISRVQRGGGAERWPAAGPRTGCRSQESHGLQNQLGYGEFLN